MEFLNLIQVCHPQDVVLMPGPKLGCNRCQTVVMEDVYASILQPHTDYFHSSALAQAYHAWTGDEGVRLNFPLVDLTGIYSTVVCGQSMGRVRRSIRLLRALNAPFTTRPEVEVEQDMNDFLKDFLNIIHEHPSAESANERLLLEALMHAMHDMLSQKDILNPFETYFSHLVPYAQKCLPQWQPLPAQDEDPNLAKELLFQLMRSCSIRNTFGRYALPFDVLHVMVACYACSSDMDVVGNWALDFLVRICRGNFFWTRFPDNPFVESMRRLLETEISYRKHTDFYKVLRVIRKGEVSEHYSVLLDPFHQLQAFLKDRFKIPEVSPDVLDLAFSYTFPAVVFPQHADQLGFTMGYNHILMTMNRKNGQIPKGTYKTARRVHETVKRFIDRVMQFDSIRLEWTVDTVKLFLASDPEFEQEIMEVVKTLIVE